MAAGRARARADVARAAAASVQAVAIWTLAPNTLRGLELGQRSKLKNRV